MFTKGSGKGKRRFFTQLIIYFMLLFVISQLLSLQAYWGLQTAYERSLIHLQTSISSSVSASIDNMLGEIFQANYLISLDESVQMAYYSDETLKGENYYIFPQVIRTLSSVTAYSDYIDGIAIYRRNDGLVVSDKAVYRDTDYFESFHRYEEYGFAHWKSIPDSQKSFSLQKPTMTYSYMDRNSSMLLPLICSGSFGSYSNSLFIVDLDYGAIQKKLDRYLTTPNSEIYILKKESDEILFSSSNAAQTQTLNLSSENQRPSESFFRQTVNGNKTIVIMQEERINLQPVRVVTMIPQSDISATLRKNSLIILAMSLFFNMAVAPLLIRILSNKAYSPVKQLLQNTAPDTVVTDENEFEVLQRIYSNAENVISSTKNELQFTQNIAREQVLRKALLGKEFSPAEAKYIRGIPDGAGASAYRIAIIQPVYKQAIYEDFSADFTDNVLEVIKNVIAVMFTFCKTWVVEMDNDRLVLFMSGTKPQQEALIRGACQQIIQIFQEDESYLSLLIFLDEDYIEFGNLTQYYRRMLQSISNAAAVNCSRIINCSEEAGTGEMVLTLEMENRIVNLLASGKKKEARQQLKQIISQCTTDSFSRISLSNVVMQLYFAGTKALSQHNLTVDSKTNQAFSEFMANLQSKSPDVIVTHLDSFFSQVADRCASMDTPLNLQLFRSYLDENYNKDLSLDMLAEKYHTSPQYISRLIKKEVGMTYQSYLNHLRITKAQELLVSTDLSVTEIYEQVGYHSRNTFVKTFKAISGVAPSDYRKIHSKKDET